MTKICEVFEPSTDGSKCEVFEDTTRATMRGNTSKTTVLPGFYRIGCGSAQRCVLPDYFPVDFVTAIVVNPPERKHLCAVAAVGAVDISWNEIR